MLTTTSSNGIKRENIYFCISFYSSERAARSTDNMVGDSGPNSIKVKDFLKKILRQNKQNIGYNIYMYIVVE